MMTDPLADMLTRIRNGQQARKTSVMTPASKLRGSVLDVLQREGYIRGYAAAESDTGKPAFLHRAEVPRRPPGDCRAAAGL